MGSRKRLLPEEHTLEVRPLVNLDMSKVADGEHIGWVREPEDRDTGQEYKGRPPSIMKPSACTLPSSSQVLSPDPQPQK